MSDQINKPTKGEWLSQREANREIARLTTEVADLDSILITTQEERKLEVDGLRAGLAKLRDVIDIQAAEIKQFLQR
tara:strand:+ start:9315 stop:9542 length:228 start_codon:yes stop_codon:yes gene_type:complete